MLSVGRNERPSLLPGCRIRDAAPRRTELGSSCAKRPFWCSFSFPGPSAPRQDISTETGCHRHPQRVNLGSGNCAGKHEGTMNESQIMVTLAAYFVVVFFVGLPKLLWDRSYGTPVLPMPQPPAQYPLDPESTLKRRRPPARAEACWPRGEPHKR